MKYQLVPVADLQQELLTTLSKVDNITLSLAYYSLINANAAPLAGLDQSITSRLSPDFKQFVCAKFDTDTQKWVYNKKKAIKLTKDLNQASDGTVSIIFQQTDFDTFVKCVMLFLNIEPEELTPEQETAKADKSARGRLDKGIEALVALGYDYSQLSAIIQDSINKTGIRPVTAKAA